MTNFSEKRKYTRMDILYEIQCAKKNEVYQAWCTTLSGSGISFLSQHEFEIGDEIKISVLPPSEKSDESTITFSSKVVRCHKIENDFFEIGATLGRMKDSEFVELSYRLNA